MRFNNLLKIVRMKRLLLFCFMLTLTLAMRATIVTFQAPEGCEFLDAINVDNDVYIGATVDETTQQSVYSIDLMPGEHSVKASLIFTESGRATPFGSSQTFTVGDEPSVVTYSLDNFALLKFALKDEQGKALYPASVQVYGDSYDKSAYADANEEGLAEFYVASDLGHTCTYKVEAQSASSEIIYAPLTGSFSLEEAKKTLNISYENYRRLTVAVKGTTSQQNYSVEIYDLNREENSSGLVVSGYADPESMEVTFLLSDGEYCCKVENEVQYDQNPQSFTIQKIEGQPVTVDVDMSKCIPVEMKYSNNKAPFTAYPIFDGVKGYLVSANYPSHLSPGSYLFTTTVGGESFGEATGYYNQTINVADAPVSLSISPSDFHHVNFVLNSDEYEGLEYYIYVGNKNAQDGSAGMVTSDDETPDLYRGDFDYYVAVLWLNNFSYACPYGNRGSFTVKDADVSVPIDLSKMRLFKASLNGMRSIDNVSFTNEKGEKKNLSMIVSGMGLALPVGKYTVEGSLNGQKMNCTLDVPENCPDVLVLDFKDVPVGIESVMAQNNLSVQVEKGGLYITASEHAVVSVSLYDLWGRCVSKQSVNSGEYVSTTNLTPGVYVARLSAGSATRTVKFMVH